MKSYPQEQQMIQQTEAVVDDGSVYQFAADYPGVMIVLMGLLAGLCWWLLKRKLQ